MLFIWLQEKVSQVRSAWSVDSSGCSEHRIQSFRLKWCFKVFKTLREQVLREVLLCSDTLLYVSGIQHKQVFSTSLTNSPNKLQGTQRCSLYFCYYRFITLVGAWNDVSGIEAVSAPFWLLCKLCSNSQPFKSISIFIIPTATRHVPSLSCHSSSKSMQQLCFSSVFEHQ